MGRQREPFDPAKHTMCKCGWFYNKNIPANKLEQHKQGRIIACSKKMKDCRALCYSTLHPWNTSHYKKNFLVYQHGLLDAEFRSLGHMECIRLKRTVPMPFEHLGWLKTLYHTLEKAIFGEFPM